MLELNKATQDYLMKHNFWRYRYALEAWVGLQSHGLAYIDFCADIDDWAHGEISLNEVWVKSGTYKDSIIDITPIEKHYYTYEEAIKAAVEYLCENNLIVWPEDRYWTTRYI